MNSRRTEYNTTCTLCGKKFKPKTNLNKICERKHYYKCVDCGEIFEINKIKELNNYNSSVLDSGVGITLDNIDKQDITIIEDSEDRFIISLNGKRCKECYKRFMNTPERKKIRREKFNNTFKNKHGGLSRSDYLTCTECGGKNGKHKKTCSKYRDPGKCEYCGYSLQSRTHAKDCPLYKEPNRCSECGGIKGHHKKTCSKYVVITNNMCPICGGTKSYHKRWCPDYRDLGKCPECGYDLRSNMHSPTCSHYDKDKAKEIRRKIEATTKKHYGVNNILMLPEIREKALRCASQSMKSPKVSKLNCRILESVLNLGDIKSASQEIFVGGYYYDLMFEADNGRKVLVEISPCISHNSDYGYYYLIAGKSNNVPPNKRAGLDKNRHSDIYYNARENGYELITFMQMFSEDMMVKVIRNRLLLDVKSVSSPRFKNIAKKTAYKFTCNNMCNPPRLRKRASYIALLNGDDIAAVVRIYKTSKYNILVDEIVNGLDYNISEAVELISEHLKTIYKSITIISDNCLPLDRFIKTYSECKFAEERSFWAGTGDRRDFVYDDDLNNENIIDLFNEIFTKKKYKLKSNKTDTMHENGLYRCYNCGCTLFKL